MKLVKKVILPIVLIIIGIFLLNFISAYRMGEAAAAQVLDIKVATRMHIISVLFAFLLGVLVKWKSIVALIQKQASIKISGESILGLILLLIALIPPAIVFIHISGRILPEVILLPFPKESLGVNMILAPLSWGNGIQIMLGVISGVFISQGLVKFPKNK